MNNNASMAFKICTMTPFVLRPSIRVRKNSLLKNHKEGKSGKIHNLSITLSHVQTDNNTEYTECRGKHLDEWIINKWKTPITFIMFKWSSMELRNLLGMTLIVCSFTSLAAACWEELQTEAWATKIWCPPPPAFPREISLSWNKSKSHHLLISVKFNCMLKLVESSLACNFFLSSN